MSFKGPPYMYDSVKKGTCISSAERDHIGWSPKNQYQHWRIAEYGWGTHRLGTLSEPGPLSLRVMLWS